jgi:ADP-ribose pyrophosphatase YjhB (NUDIX family)
MGNPITIHVVAGAVLEKDGKYLLVQEKKPHIYGLWNLPVGKVEEWETSEGTAIREVKEEVNLDIILK